MKAIPAIYEHGKIFFQFSYPDTEGPVTVLVIFPPEVEEVDLEEELTWIAVGESKQKAC